MKERIPFTLKELFSLAQRFSFQEGTCFLYSAGHDELVRTSLLFLFPFEKIAQKAFSGIWEDLAKKISPGSTTEWAGFIGYEMGSYADADKILPYTSSLHHDCCFYRYACTLSYDHSLSELEVSINENKIESCYHNLSWLKGNRLRVKNSHLKIIETSDTPDSYAQKIALAKEWIREGEIYQVNLSRQFLFKGTFDPFSLFYKIAWANPAPFSAFFNCGSFSILSTSPERLLSYKGGILETRPIKGTAPRGKTADEDEAFRLHLLSSEKDRAELLMITDLMRNDLGKIASIGSVATKEIWKCEKYASVHHLISIIQAKPNEERHPLEMLRAVFPGGSITGCPKLRSMEAIAALENRPRGIYTGSIGYLGSEGAFDFNIAIRTMIARKDTIELQLGGAIVIDSDPIQEYEETLHKGAALFKILNAEGSTSCPLFF